MSPVALSPPAIVVGVVATVLTAAGTILLAVTDPQPLREFERHCFLQARYSNAWGPSFPHDEHATHYPWAVWPLPWQSARHEAEVLLGLLANFSVTLEGESRRLAINPGALLEESHFEVVVEYRGHTYSASIHPHQEERTRAGDLRPRVTRSRSGDVRRIELTIPDLEIRANPNRLSSVERVVFGSCGSRCASRWPRGSARSGCRPAPAAETGSGWR
jgi:hypothetical protein